MVSEIEERLRALEERRERLLGEYAELTEAQRAFRPGADAWSLLEVAEHLLIAESVATAAMEESGAAPPRRTLRQRALGWLVTLVLALGFKVKAPSRRLLPKAEMSLAELSSEWRAVGERLRARLERLGSEEIAGEAFRHPISGPLDFRQGLDFLRRHFDHHLRQVARIRSAPGFARSAAAE